MGFYFRKSINFGPVRLNFSKSGIGVSAGVKGARISTGPRGTYIHSGRNGFYYSQRIGGGSSQSRYQPSSNQQPFGQTYAPPPASAYVIETADVSRLVETSSAELLNQINSTAAQTRFAPLAFLCTLAVTGLVFFIVLVFAAPLADLIVKDRDYAVTIATIAAVVAALATFIGGLLFSWRVHKGDQLKRTTPLFYELEEDALHKFRTIQQACEALSRSARIWRVQTNQPTWDWKRNAGASSLITRQPLHIGLQQPPFIATNVDVWGIQLSDMTLFFMPDYVFVRQRGSYGAVSYESLSVSFAPTRFIEEQGVPQDARVVDYTWRFVNKNGGPDRRFANNQQLPIAQYGLIQLQSATGLNIHLNISNIESASFFADSLNRILSPSRWQQQQRRREYTAGGREHKGQRKPDVGTNIKSAHKILGVPIGASVEQVVAAYRQMAKMYHPDRLANLAPEFIELAEERMKEINAAYEELKR
ncbi:MAG TPA: DUF4236 domain-containing protein [Pyrinomonadaceae bacterium]|jgi:hypothetical protein